MRYGASCVAAAPSRVSAAAARALRCWEHMEVSEADGLGSGRGGGGRDRLRHIGRRHIDAPFRKRPATISAAEGRI